MLTFTSVFAALMMSWFGRKPARPKLRRARTKVPVSEAMNRKIHAVRPDDSLGEAARWLVETGQHPLPIIDRGTTVGVLTRHDVATGLQTAGDDATVAAAPHHGAIAVGPHDSIDDLVDQLADRPDAIAVVMDDGAPVGIVTAEQLATYVALHAR